MPRVRELLRFLEHYGYRKVRQTGSHLILEHSQRRTVVIPVHTGDLPRGLFLRILKDADSLTMNFSKNKNLSDFFVFFYFSVAQTDDPVRFLRDVRLVRDQDDCVALLMQAREQGHDFLAGL